MKRSVMILWGVAYEGVTELYVHDQRMKTRANNYKSEILEKIVKLLNPILFADKHEIFQQNSTFAHKIIFTKRSLKRNIPAFITTEGWPSGSPDLNQLDYRHFKVNACSKPHGSV